MAMLSHLIVADSLTLGHLVESIQIYGVSRIHRKRERDGNNQWKMPDEGYNVIIQIKFYSMVLLGNTVGPFCPVSLKQSKLSNRAVTEYFALEPFESYWSDLSLTHTVTTTYCTFYLDRLQSKLCLFCICKHCGSLLKSLHL